MARNPEVKILLSTYNGERFLEELAGSLWRQSYQNFQLRVRDDGSTDGTAILLGALASSPRVESVEFGHNLGAAQSFMQLLRSVAREPSECACLLCDQDDVWLPDKVERAAAALADASGPTMYCSAVTVVNPHLVPLWRHPSESPQLSFANALVENVATGATIALNREAVELASRHEPARMLMHDAWLYLLISGAGKVLFDDQPTVLYRQHTGNAVGLQRGLRDWLERIHRQLLEGHQRVLTEQALEFRALYYDELTAHNRVVLDEFLSGARTFRSRFRYARNGKAFRQRWIDDKIFRMLYVARRV